MRVTASPSSALPGHPWNLTDIARPFPLPKQTPTRKKDTSKTRRIQEKHSSEERKDLLNFDKKLLPSVNHQSVDSNDTPRANSAKDRDLLNDTGIKNNKVLNTEITPRNKLDRKSISSDKEFVKRLPNAVIIGVKKGGTRALLEILKIHPRIRACNSEVHFFDRDINYERGLSWYRENMPPSYPQDITIEKSPAYFVTDKVPERMYNMSKTVKLLVVVRDPTKRAVSDYTQSLAKKPDNYPFETFAVKDLKKGIINVNWMKLKIGLYAKHLEKWLEFFPLNQIHFVSGEELIYNPAKEVRLVEKFLNLKHFITEANFVFNETKGFFCLIGKRPQVQNSSKPRCMGKSKGRKHPKVRNSVLELLKSYFRPHNLRFYEMVNRDFGWS
ncbi:heparan sulfate glucosamine 3-O-sulfotransferase 2 [Exaiptasia diaphana]|uniref:Sulfotransferase domain-containing protein n=1 Tax=Exaiptasia diaphana TaxID=2652724 RepID=A0A913XH30_EXADI|nr:heparan sulfate glucosamine 3-O-sulfotransferase 2 [Exaiptasia diaphana]